MPEQPNAPLGQSGGSALGAAQSFSAPDENVGSSRSSRSRSEAGAGSTDAARRAISTVANEAGSKVVSGLDTQKSKAAEGLGSVAQALRQTSDDLRRKDEGPIHQYVASAADQVERFSGYLRSKNVNEMVSEVEDFARRQPALFLGSAFLLGLLGARFLKSSGQSSGGYGTTIADLRSTTGGQQRGTSGYTSPATRTSTPDAGGI
jgi:hypothetical protein